MRVEREGDVVSCGVMWWWDVTTSVQSSERNVNNPGNNSPGSVSQFKGWKWITRSGWLESREQRGLDWPVIILRGGSGCITAVTLHFAPTTRDIFITIQRIHLTEGRRWQKNLMNFHFGDGFHSIINYIGRRYCCLDLDWDSYLCYCFTCSL